MPIRARFCFALEQVPDLAAARRFYAEVLGLAVEREHPTFVQFGSFAIGTEPNFGGPGSTDLYWTVDDAAAAFRDLSSKAEVTLPLTKKPYGQVFGVKAPDGRPRYFIEFAQVRPSQAVGTQSRG